VGASAGYVVYRILFGYQSGFQFSRKKKLDPTAILSLFSEARMPEQRTQMLVRNTLKSFSSKCPNGKLFIPLKRVL